MLGEKSTGLMIRLAALVVALAAVVVMFAVSILPSLDRISVGNIQDHPVSISSETFPDSALCSYVKSHFDKDGDGYLSKSERDAVTSIGSYDSTSFAVKEKGLDGLGITTLDGIEQFENLESLVASNNSIAKLDVSGNKNLRHVDMRGNPSFEISRSSDISGLQLLVDRTFSLGGNTDGMDVRYVD